LSIDLACRTNLPGLLAAGSSSKNDATGTHASAGSPTAFCNVSGYQAGETAALESRSCELPDLPLDAVAELRGQAFAPLLRDGDGTTSDFLHDKLARLEASILDGMILNEERLRRFLAVTDEVRAASAQARAADLHDLVKLHEARNVADCAGVVYQAALDRTESREQFYREDYPETDPDWFCWHGVRLTEHGLAFDRAPIPLAGAKFQPVGEIKGKSPIAAIFSGETETLEHA
jgi:succinate dehydrogenase/fumarate reductase flavoprotein subunit